jgi:hypothetical protein
MFSNISFCRCILRSWITSTKMSGLPTDIWTRDLPNSTATHWPATFTALSSGISDTGDHTLPTLSHRWAVSKAAHDNDPTCVTKSLWLVNWTSTCSVCNRTVSPCSCSPSLEGSSYSSPRPMTTTVSQQTFTSWLIVQSPRYVTGWY